MITNPNHHGTQKERILQYFLDHHDRRIKCYEFTDNLRIMNHTARLTELKHEGWNIINYTHRVFNPALGKSQKHSDYELVITPYQQ